MAQELRSTDSLPEAGELGDVAMGAVGLATVGAGRIAAQAQRTAALKDATSKIRDIKAMTGLAEAEKPQRLQKLQKVATIHKGDAVAKGFLPKVSSWGGAILRHPKAPADVVMKYSPGAQKIASSATLLTDTTSSTEPSARLERRNTFAELAEPVVKKHVP